MKKLITDGFFGWNNFKWICREVLKIYSSKEDSFFSKKRIESGIAFIILQWGMIHWLVFNVNMTSSDLLIWSGIECVICGYTISKIEDAKKSIKDDTISKG
jgi:hypothetical protein